MKWEAEFRAADREFGLLLSGQFGGEFVGEVTQEMWPPLRVQIINAFNTVLNTAPYALPVLADLDLLSKGVTAEIYSWMIQHSLSGEVHVEFAEPDPATAALIEERRAAGPAAPDAFVIGATGAAATVPTGTEVMVQWDDGNRYPGTVVRASSNQYLITFSDGRHLWIDGSCIILPK